MQMEQLRCKSPARVRKEIHCHMIGYNLVRSAMKASALKFQICPTHLIFTGAMQAVEEFASSLRLQSGRRNEQWENLLETISEMRAGDRPGRQENWSKTPTQAVRAHADMKKPESKPLRHRSLGLTLCHSCRSPF